MSYDDAKKAAAVAAADLIQPHTDVGIGSGSTVAHFIDALSRRVRGGLVLKSVVCASQHSSEHARRERLPVKELNEVQRLAIAVDGADELDAEKRMIKGGGAALVRERIVASASAEFMIIIDESKRVSHLGKTLPVEILSFGSEVTKKKLEHLGYSGVWREQIVTENGNFLLDLHCSTPLQNPEKDYERIRSVPGVIDAGLFCHMAGRVIIGFQNGTVKVV